MHAASRQGRRLGCLSQILFRELAQLLLGLSL